MPVRRAKIICTLGPASDGPGGIESLVELGMDVARLNFSHGTSEQHGLRAERVRRAAEQQGRPVALLQDLCGPKIRTGVGGPTVAEVGEQLELCAGTHGQPGRLAIQYPTLTEDLHVGDRLLLGDGDIELKVTAVGALVVTARVVNGGALRDHLGVNLPAARLRGGALTEKDLLDVEHGIAIGVDWVALSFVRHPEEVRRLRRELALRGSKTPIVVKVETPQALEHLEELVAEADAVMVARGDLGVELSPERVPVVQKRILGVCRAQRKPAIVATEMLQSMVASARPTRAEASDVAGAVFDGADAVMLSAETATGAYPLAACRMMSLIIKDAEASQFYCPPQAPIGPTAADAIAHAACDVAASVGAALIVVLTTSGSTGLLVSKARPRVPVLALSSVARTRSLLALVWGLSPRAFREVQDVDAVIADLRHLLASEGWLESGQRYVVVYGAPLGVQGTTNSIRVETLP